MVAGRNVPKGRFISSKITRRIDLTDDLWKIWIKPEEPFNFKPGQYCTIGFDGIERPYSIVSSPDEDELELFIELVPYPDGNLTPKLHGLDIGASLTLRPRPKGLFVLQPQFKHHVFIGTVTGTVPYISILRKFLNDKDWPSKGIQKDLQRFYVLEGASYQDEFGYDEELKQMDIDNTFIRFTPSISRPDEKRNTGWTGATGRINHLVEEYINERTLSPEETCIYACGHPQMIEDVRQKFENTGYHFIEERFWKSDD